MTEDEILGIILETDKLQIEADPALAASANLFCKSWLTNCSQLNRICTCDRVNKAWLRWKQERNFVPNDVVERSLFKTK